MQLPVLRPIRLHPLHPDARNNHPPNSAQTRPALAE
jgi:hypothetical protein